MDFMAFTIKCIEIFNLTYRRYLVIIVSFLGCNIGVSYYFSKKALVAVEWETTSFDSAKDEEAELLVGAAFKF